MGECAGWDGSCACRAWPANHGDAAQRGADGQSRQRRAAPAHLPPRTARAPPAVPPWRPRRPSSAAWCWWWATSGCTASSAASCGAQIPASRCGLGSRALRPGPPTSLHVWPLPSLPHTHTPHPTPPAPPHPHPPAGAQAAAVGRRGGAQPRAAAGGAQGAGRRVLLRQPQGACVRARVAVVVGVGGGGGAGRAGTSRAGFGSRHCRARRHGRAGPTLIRAGLPPRAPRLPFPGAEPRQPDGTV